MIKLDGSYGEGGGALVRTALAISTLTGKPFEVFTGYYVETEKNVQFHRVDSCFFLTHNMFVLDNTFRSEFFLE